MAPRQRGPGGGGALAAVGPWRRWGPGGGGALAAVVPWRRWCPGSGAPAGDNPGQQSQATIIFSSMSQFYLDCGESKLKFLSPISILNNGRGSRLPETQRTRRSLVFSPNGSFMQACIIVLHVMRHNTEQHLRYSVSIRTHTCGARTVVAHWAKYSGQAKQRKGEREVTWYDDIWGQIPNQPI